MEYVNRFTFWDLVQLKTRAGPCFWTGPDDAGEGCGWQFGVGGGTDSGQSPKLTYALAVCAGMRSLSYQAVDQRTPFAEVADVAGFLVHRFLML